jgi:hypothetical protein
MDPISIIASAIVIAQPLAASLQMLQEIKHAKNDLLLLANELAEIIVILNEIDRITCQQHTHGQSSGPNSSLLRALHPRKVNLTQLQQEVLSWNKGRLSDTNSTQPPRIRWLHIASKVKTFKNVMQGLRLQLLTLLSTMTL